jgi:ribosomal protein S13
MVPFVDYRLKSSDAGDKRSVMGENLRNAQSSHTTADIVSAAIQKAFTDHEELCYTSNVISPQDISKDMLKKVTFNLNRQAEVGMCRGMRHRRWVLTVSLTGIDDLID